MHRANPAFAQLPDRLIRVQIRHWGWCAVGHGLIHDVIQQRLKIGVSRARPTSARVRGASPNPLPDQTHGVHVGSTQSPILACASITIFTETARKDPSNVSTRGLVQSRPEHQRVPASASALTSRRAARPAMCQLLRRLRSRCAAHLGGVLAQCGLLFAFRCAPGSYEKRPPSRGHDSPAQAGGFERRPRDPLRASISKSDIKGTHLNRGLLPPTVPRVCMVAVSLSGSNNKRDFLLGYPMAKTDQRLGAAQIKNARKNVPAQPPSAFAA